MKLKKALKKILKVTFLLMFYHLYIILLCFKVYEDASTHRK